MKFHNNRSHNLTQYLKKFGWKKAEPNEPSDFSLWDTYNKNDVDSLIKVWPKEFYSIIDCLWTWHKRLEKFNLTHLAPLTITDWDKQKLDECDFKKDDLWFFKQIFGVHGKGINLFSTFKDYQKISNFVQAVGHMQGPCLVEDLTHYYILQKGIVDTHLIQGRKYILRVYTLSLGNGKTRSKNATRKYEWYGNIALSAQNIEERKRCKRFCGCQWIFISSDKGTVHNKRNNCTDNWSRLS